MSSYSAKKLTFDSLPAWREKMRREKKRVVATNGCFDILHVGHIRYLEQARALGDILIIGVNSDSSVRQLKGEGRPLNLEEERAELLSALECVGATLIFEDMRAIQFLAAVEPDIYVKGGDYTLESLNQEEVAAVRKGGGEIQILPLVPGRSTSNLIERILKL